VKIQKMGDVRPMTCLICAGAAARIVCQGPWEERDCPSCGRYRVADALILTLMEQGQIFDVGKTRNWLERQRLTDTLPCIEIHMALPDAHGSGSRPAPATAVEVHEHR
jgi:hypothetical protein